MPSTLNDHACMAEALRLAKKGLFTVRKNPRVGCVIVREGGIIGRGYHAKAGQPHAESNALADASGPIDGSTVYITLEPCAHVGKTPPCTEALIAAKVARVVVAVQDPNPLVSGKGLASLRQHGIETHCDVMPEEAHELNKGFFKRMCTSRPYVTVKSAISLDGKTALANGKSQWITGVPARHDVHRLRARSCAILSGIGTVMADDPQLTARLSSKAQDEQEHVEQPLRVILDTRLRIQDSARVLHAPGKALVYTCSQDAERIDRLRSENVEVVALEQPSIPLDDVMRDLGAREINEVFVEAGATLVGSLLGQGLADEFIVYIAPHLIGESGRGLAILPSISDMQARLGLRIEDITQLGDDIRVRARPGNA